jgi:hypothetical protein
MSQPQTIPRSLLRHEGDDDKSATFKRQPLPISSEFDTMRQSFCQDDVDRSGWLQQALRDNPEVRTYREQVNPVVRAATFGRLYLPPNRIISPDILLMLISQHLRTLGLVKSQEALHSEWDTTWAIPVHLMHSQLTYLIQRGIFRAEKFWELAHGSDTTGFDEEISKTIGGAPVIADDVKPLERETIADPNFLRVSPDGTLQEASLNQLILLLTTDTEIKMKHVATAVCIHFKSFTNSRIMFSKVRERFRMTFKNYDRRGSELTYKFLERWLKKSPGEIEHAVLEAIRVFSEKELAPQFQRQSVFTGHESSPGKAEHFIDYSRAPRVDLGHCKGLWEGQFSLLDLPAIEIARQMTYWTCVRYYAVQRSELVDGAWNKPRLKHRAPNVSAIFAHGSMIYEWAATEMLRCEPADRKRVFSFFVEVVINLWELQNYWDGFLLYSGLDKWPILVKFKDLASGLTQKDQQTLDIIKKYWVDDGASSPLKRKLHDAARESKQPSVPYLGVLLTDLFRYCEAEIPELNGELINISKFTKIHHFIKLFESFKNPKYCFLPVDQVQGKLDNLPVESEDWQRDQLAKLDAGRS